MFSLVCALPSPASAEACASLFDWFTGTTAQSDFSGTCMSAVWFMAFADRSCSFEQDVREISRFSCMLFLSVRGFSDYAGPNSHSRNSVAAVLPFSISEGSRHPDPSAFRSSIAPAHWYLWSTLHKTPHGAPCKTRGQDGVAVLLSCRALSSPTTCRFIPAHSEWPTNLPEPLFTR